MSDTTRASRTPKRFTDIDLIDLEHRLEHAGASPAWDRAAHEDALDAITYARWLYARRGRLVERLLLLASVGRLSREEVAAILLETEWDEDDGYVLREAQQRGKTWW